MRRRDRVSAQPARSSIPMAAALILLLILPVFARAQSDPLSPSYMPSIDTNPADYPSNIWITDTMQKVRQDSGSPGTQHWGTFYGTQNEFVDFQIHFQDTGSGTSNLNVIASNFVQSSPSSYTILASSTNIIVYREAYVNVNTKTSTAATFYNSTGYYPDILIPAVDPYYHQTTNAWPFTVAASNNQSAWVDIHIPPNAPSGYYVGSITVKSGSTTLATMPVIIAVWQWPSAGQMSSTSTLNSRGGVGWADACIQFYGGYSSCSSYPGASGSNDKGVELSIIDMSVLMLDHRYSTADPIYDSGPDSSCAPGTNVVTDWGPLYNGTAANTQTILLGAKQQQADFASCATLNSTNVQNWATFFQTNGWNNLPFDYSCDEPPNGCAWTTIAANSTILHQSNPQMPALVTTNIANATTNGVLNDIDWMVPIINDLDPQGGSLQRSAYNTWLKGNCCGAGSPIRKLWSYQSCESAGTCSNGTTGGSQATWPNYDVDGKPAANRGMEWMTFFHNQSGELYYSLTYAWEGTNNPWTNVYFFGGNGDGTLLYPGTSATVGVTNPIFLPSIRLKHIRDGMQDYEYLNELTNAGQGTLVQNQIASWITNSYTFETTGSGLQSARSALGTAMQQLSYPVVILPPTNLTATPQ